MQASPKIEKLNPSPASSPGRGEYLGELPEGVQCEEYILRTGKKDVAVGVFNKKKKNFDLYTPQELFLLLSAFNVRPHDLPREVGTMKRIVRLWYILKDQVDSYVAGVEEEARQESKKRNKKICFKFPTIRGELIETLDYKKPQDYRKMIKVGLGGLFGIGVILAASKLR